jgi:hypothetical protein
MNRTYRWESEALGCSATLSVSWQDGMIHGLTCLEVCDWNHVGDEFPPRKPSTAEEACICQKFLETFDTGWWDTRQTIERRCRLVL